MELEFLKCHGSGNDFIIIDEWSKDYAFSETERVELAKQLSRRNAVIGSDGILFVLPSSKAHAAMRMFNSDGSEAEMCGNGLRCVARYVLEIAGKDKLTIETMKANLEVARVPDVYEGVQSFEVAIEPVSFETDTLPLKNESRDLISQPIPQLHQSLRFTALSVPNPHLVALVEDINDEMLEEIGNKANANKDILPNGTNVSFVKDLGEGSIFVRTFERGVGLTNACGTAMSASTVVSCVLGNQNLDEVITVLNPGGMVQTKVFKKDESTYAVKLRGNATYEFSGIVDLHLNKEENTQLLEIIEFEEEQALYQQMADFANKKTIKL
ncbi:diaminopimelate epimerase [Alkalicoccus daliensis]|uniref:Diaminopimelate epimerase n=1 Tax=Alkalicoccus daliensis TaxID=745820 RepID=A0A1H0BHL7_9BACI|nr:diaminopimelate epimerase [Alkalicoccus daliensis]SDN45055.1 diaminopimelate epimerase [Alkalicoccus daliensis]